MSIKTPRSIPSILCLLIGSMGLGASACRDDAEGNDAAATESSETQATTTASDETATSGETATVTFWQDIAPVFYEHCVSRGS